ncbi:hypothetical protein KXV74_004074 [Aspergillus fumigatus]|nr:hypothetical protein KXX14_003458 [Aspergillus fumigatus]KAH1754295.1 hypothetical protein KXX09_005081 [Aspergillus fumigatus]KAH1920907.1 hypothetical protein KXW47_008079 [Aspergillus fumigatus]KAH1965315.1 hypothetical protein KXX04_002686 [Aspergillus fumigatus]KAH1995133.1 hypothetical protein KXV33_001922 [Aspergillus fumigatus]
MASDQLLYLASQRIIIQDNGKKPDKFMVMQWILTLEGLENAPGTGLEDHSISIESFATRIPYPSVVLLDYVGDLQQLYDDQPVRKELITFGMAMNLAIAICLSLAASKLTCRMVCNPTFSKYALPVEVICIIRLPAEHPLSIPAVEERHLDGVSSVPVAPPNRV